MFFQQTHNARNAAEEADESEMGPYYLETPPWGHPGKKRFSTVSGMSSRSRRTTVGSSGGTDQMSHSRSGSLESSPQQARETNILPMIGPGMYLRQASMARSSSMAQSRTSFTKPSSNPVWRFIKRVMSSSFGLFLFIQTYLCIGAFCFMWMEAVREEEQWELMKNLRIEVAENLTSCMGNLTCQIDLLKKWEGRLVRFPPIYLEIGTGTVWSWIYSYYCSFTIISTIGYGNVTPLSVIGRMFAIVYAVIGIPLMLLFITDIGNKFARWTKIAIIAFRKWKYVVCERCKRSTVKKDDTELREEGQRDEDVELEVKEIATSEVKGGTVSSNEVHSRFKVPEVHINLAMSTLDEETSEPRNKRGDIEDQMHLHCFVNSEQDSSSLYVSQENSEYGSSSTGVEGCYTEDHEIPQENFPRISVGDVNLAPGWGPFPTEVDTGLTQGVEVTDSVQQRDLDNSDNVSGISDDVFDGNVHLQDNASDFVNANDAVVKDATNAESPSAENAMSPALKCDEITVIVDRTLEELEVPVQAVRIDIDTLETTTHQSEGLSHVQYTAVDLMKCDKCGQYLRSGHIENISTENIDNVRTSDSGSRRKKRRRGLDNNSPKRKHSENLNKLSRSKSKSLENISQRDSIGRRSTHRSVLRRCTDRRTSAPGVVSFEPQPVKQNGRLPYQIKERTRSDSSDLAHDAKPNTDYEGEFRDRTATDSGVASSSSNSTECSPKRQPNYAYIDVGDETMDSDSINGSSHGDVSDDDVMDSEEERKISKLRHRTGMMDRLATAGEFTRISEADIAMLSIPIWLALLLLLLYLLLGAGCFAAMQQWTFLDGFYYCFISLSTIGFGDLVFLPQNVHAGLIFSFLYSFFGLCFTSMCMSLSSLELTLLSRKISAKFGVYGGRIRMRSVRWASRRRRAIRGQSPDAR